MIPSCFFFNDTATTEIYTLSLHDALPISTVNSGCEYAEINYDCDGNCTADMDCAGECGGNAMEDECGVCDGSGPIENYDCDGNCTAEVDCSGECGGSAELDACRVCEIGRASCRESA